MPSYTTTPPATVDYLTPDLPTTTAPTPVTPAALSAVAPSHSTPGAPTTTAPTPILPDAFVELTGGSRPLSARTVLPTDVGLVVAGTIAGVQAHYQVIAGTNVQALPTIVHPANYDPVTNAFVFSVVP